MEFVQTTELVTKVIPQNLCIVHFLLTLREAVNASFNVVWESTWNGCNVLKSFPLGMGDCYIKWKWNISLTPDGEGGNLHSYGLEKITLQTFECSLPHNSTS